MSRVRGVYQVHSHHNAVFVGRDEEDHPRYAAVRGVGTSFIGEASGSDKHYSFSIPAEQCCERCTCLSQPLICYLMPRWRNWTGRSGERTSVVSGRGLPASKEIEKSKVPAALARALKMHPEVKTIVFSFG